MRKHLLLYVWIGTKAQYGRLYIKKVGRMLPSPLNYYLKTRKGNRIQKT